MVSLADDGHGSLWIGFLDGALSKVRGGIVYPVVPPSPGRAVSALTVKSGR